jgi:hypothetical protein
VYTNEEFICGKRFTVFKTVKFSKMKIGFYSQIENNFRFSLFLITPNIKKYIKYFLSQNTRRIS